MHIYFDFFGTLCDASTTSLEATRKILARNHIENIEAEGFKSAWDQVNHHLCRGPFMLECDLFRQGFLTTCKLYGFKPDSDSVEELISATERRVLYPDAAKTLDRLQNHYRLHVASNTDNHAMDAIIGPIRSYLSSVSSSENLQVYKPNADFYAKMLDAGESTAEDSIYVGDSLLNDLIGPVQFGMEAHLIDRRENYLELANSHSTLTAFADTMLRHATKA